MRGVVSYCAWCYSSGTAPYVYAPERGWDGNPQYHTLPEDDSRRCGHVGVAPRRAAMFNRLNAIEDDTPNPVYRVLWMVEEDTHGTVSR
jgi:hypothetical protein